MTQWIDHDEIFAIPDVTAECDAMWPATKWRIVQFGKSCRRECERVRKKRCGDFAQIVAIMHKLAMTAIIRNKEQYRHEFDDIYAIKSRRGIRALGLLESRGRETAKPVFVVLTWFEKQRQSLNRQEVDRTKSRRRDFETFIQEHCDENWKTTRLRR